ncbi:SDR family oxidoreductase [Flexibacterium corallicola]|uniref:SDR family oxidoreductase n=1 Tax=Flexibacterium corallicola TaxID=3037259 RepID=UPI00286FA150|nr:SDR family oxidoreductase [Pseudovibrio sp. M1P-2-3]
MRLFVFGMGYSSTQFVKDHGHRFDWIGGTTRSKDKLPLLESMGVTPFLFNGIKPEPTIINELVQASHILVSIGPGDMGDPVLSAYRHIIAEAQTNWIAYLSTVGVYGDHDGAWVNEASECRPVSKRSVQRVQAEKDWQELAKHYALPLIVLRLAGIYGKGRNGFINLEKGSAKRIIKPGQVFNRIHVEDISGVLGSSLTRPITGIFNVCDDEPAPPQDVVSYAANLMGVAPPPEVPFEDAQMSPMARSFYGETKRCENSKVKEAFKYTFRYPTYREAFDTLWKVGYK